MRILFLSTNIGYGGASKMIVNVANSLSEKHEVTFLTFRSAEIKQKVAPSVQVVHKELYKSKIKPVEIIGQIYKLHSFIRNHNFDIAVAFLHPSHYLLTLACCGLKTKVLLSERGDPISRIKNGGIFIKVIEHIIHNADFYVFQSDGAKKAYPIKCQKKSEIIVNALPNIYYPKRNFKSIERSVVFVARFELKQKRQDIMVKAFKLFLQSHPDYVLRFYGDGPDEAYIKKLCNQLGISGSVKFIGESSNVLEEIVQAGMFVLTSDFEGLPNSLLEAMALGIPCISTDCSPGGARMIIKNEYNGFIVPKGDISEIANKMSILAEDERLRDMFSKRAMDVRKLFNQLDVSAKWNGVIERMYNEK